MSQRSAEHATFVIERSYDAPPQRVFRAWSEPTLKARWFGPKTLPEDGRSMEFKVGGLEHFRITTPSGETYSYDAVYQDIVADVRIVYSYDMHRDDDRISVSVSTVEFEAAGEGTKLRYTEQGVFLDGHDKPALREEGTAELLSALGDALAGGDAR
jgi:uncharacterized protein YndB with AHSA1/START domain